MIQVQNKSTVMTDAQVAKILDAVEQQWNLHVIPTWGFEPEALVLFPGIMKLDPNKRQFIVIDTSDVAGAAGYHELTSGGEPIGYAFVKTTLDAGMHPSVTISHEILEMAGDAFIDTANQWSDLPNALFLSQELCDPVEDDSLGYLINGVLVSDFVLPRYFVNDTLPHPLTGGASGMYDFMGHLTTPNTLATGGYQLTWDPTNGWQQQFANGRAEGRALISTRHSRRNRRATRANWRRSLI